MARERLPDGRFFHHAYGRVMEHEGYSLHIYWNADMIDYLKRHFARTLNEELAGCLGVSQRTMLRKARELGLRKDREWLRAVYREHGRLASAVSKKMGYPGGWKKGQHPNPATEFKPGHVLSDEAKRKQAESMRRWYETHPIEKRQKARKAAETRKQRIKQIGRIMGKLTFYEYIQSRLNGRMRDGIVTDLLVDISRDKDMKEGMTAQEIVNHIRWSGACAGAMEALTSLVKSYRLYCHQKGLEREEVTIRYVGGRV